MNCENIWSHSPRKPLPDVLDFIVDNRGKTVPTAKNGHILIATNCVRNENLYPSYEKIRYLSDDTYQHWFRAHPKPGDILFVCKGTPGRVCLVPNPVDFCIAQDMVALRVNKQIAYNKYLLAVLRNRLIQEQIAKTSVGDVIPHFKKSHFGQLLIPLPAFNIQTMIGDNYFTLSEKIENNKRINHHLEQMAQAIFKSWFVDFEPFGGTCPTHWTRGNLTDIANYQNGLAMQRFRPLPGEKGLPVLKIKELRQGSCDSASELCSPNIRADYLVHDGDVVFSWSGSLLVDFWCGGECGLNQHLFKVTSTTYDKWFYYAWTHHHLARFVAMAADKATTMGHIKREALEKAEVLIPDAEEYRRLGTVLAPLYEQIVNNRIECRRLAELRDTLLPRLMSGELSVADLGDGK